MKRDVRERMNDLQDAQWRTISENHICESRSMNTNKVPAIPEHLDLGLETKLAGISDLKTIVRQYPGYFVQIFNEPKGLFRSGKKNSLRRHRFFSRRHQADCLIKIFFGMSKW